jgi:hypothetical protein
MAEEDLKEEVVKTSCSSREYAQTKYSTDWPIPKDGI